MEGAAEQECPPRPAGYPFFPVDENSENLRWLSLSWRRSDKDTPESRGIRTALQEKQQVRQPAQPSAERMDGVSKHVQPNQDKLRQSFEYPLNNYVP